MVRRTARLELQRVQRQVLEIRVLFEQIDQNGQSVSDTSIDQFKSPLSTLSKGVDFIPL